MTEKMLIYKYEYARFNYFSPASDEVKVLGRNRDELVEQLAASRNSKALYYFLKLYPGLSKKQKMILEQLILSLEHVTSIEEFETRCFLHSNYPQYTSLLVVTEDKKNSVIF